MKTAPAAGGEGDVVIETVVFVGDHPLVVSCAGRLIEAGMRVLGVSSTDVAISEWARGQGIELVTWDELSAFLHDHRPDALFSVGNLRIVPDEMLDSVTLGVNFHDGPLPAYAGLHVPMWAILADEPRHGVAWHVIEAGVDEGDVLASADFAISPDETTRSINLKCFAAAGDSFEQLVDQLVSGSLERQTQVGTGRMCGRYDRPRPAGSVVPHTMGASEIDRLVRALDFGPTLNRVGRPLLALSSTTLMVVGDAETVPESSAPPGSVVAAEQVGERVVLTVGTPAGVVRLRGWSDAAADVGALVGSELPDPSASLAALGEAHAKAARNEVWWSRRLAVAPVAVPGVDEAASGWTESAPVSVPGGFENVATLATLYSLARSDQWTGTVGVAPAGDSTAELAPWFETVLPVTAAVAPEVTIAEAATAIGDSVAEAVRRGPYLADLGLRMPVQIDGAPPRSRPSVVVVDREAVTDAPLQFVVTDAGVVVRARGDRAAEIADGLRAFVAAASDPSRALGSLPVIGVDAEPTVTALGGAPASLPFAGALHDRFLAAAARAPAATAVIHRGIATSYGELETRSRRVARHLMDTGVRPGDFVGVSTAPGMDMVTSVLGVLMTGAAYVPLDPRFPLERLTFMAADAAMSVVLSDDPANLLVRGPAAIDVARIAGDEGIVPATDLPSVGADDLAYMMYTSGSTGQPKGVMVEHGNVDSFLQSMEPHVGTEHGVWLSVTTLSFDISVLELFHPLVHGWTIVLYEGLAAMRPKAPGRASNRLDMSIFFFGSEGVEGGGEYKVLLDSARFADERGFAAVWTPERHFNAFGGPFPNPSVTSAALAAVTSNVAIRAGSCVLPLHHPARVAEEWAVVDRLSGGRVGISVAAGWHPDDFIFRPENHGQSKAALIEQIDQLKALWRGDTVTYPGPKGPVEVTTLPRPVQPELPIWYTTAGNMESFELAGRQGYHLLTHLLGQSVEELTDKVAAYRRAWDEAGHAGRGNVTLMLHTFVADDREQVRAVVREPMKGYLRDSVMLLKDHASAFPTFDPTATEADGLLAGLTAEDLDALLEVGFARYFETSGLFGSVDECIDIAERISAAGVDEIAALVDFGIDSETVLTHLEYLDAVRRHFLIAEAAPATIETYGSLIETYEVTHLQCTPSEARIVLADDESRAALGRLERMLVGGEACPVSVAAGLLDAVGGSVINVYGPTETTIWSTAHEVGPADIEAGALPIGRPLANTTVRIVGAGGALRPVGEMGELLIGGAGVTRGYHGRVELTAERFVHRDDTDGRVYRTGDLAAFRPDGSLAFFGRGDSQVKVRGHRIELGEIEAALERRGDIAEAVVVVHGEGEAAALVGHLIADSDDRPEPNELVAALRRTLPEHMVPERWSWHAKLPTTPNGKVDRKSLAALPVGHGAVSVDDEVAPRVATPTASIGPVDATELAGIVELAWRETLKVDTIDRNKTFFDHGGNSLQVVTLRETLENKLGREIKLVDLFRYPTVNQLADEYSRQAIATGDDGGDDADLEAERGVRGAAGDDRAARRAAARRRGRRGRP